MDCYLGVDVGTSGSRAVLLSDSGNVIGSGLVAHPLETPHDGWYEQDPARWVESSADAVCDLVARVPRARVKAVAFSGQMSGPVLLDRSHHSLGPCLIWADVRSVAESELLEARSGRARFLQIAGRTPYPGYAAAKLMWLRTHRPDLWSRARSFVLPKDYVRGTVTGEFGTDLSDASNTGLFDVGRGEWSSYLMNASEIPEVFMPRLMPSMEVGGEVSATFAERSGLARGTVVLTGAGDSICAAIGAGLGATSLLSVIGSSGNVSALLRRPTIDVQGRVHTGVFAWPGAWIATGVQQSAGLALEWIGRIVRPRGASFSGLVALAARVPPGSEGVVFLPHLNGERNPRYRPDARGAFLGLSARHGPGHLVRAVIEGVAYAQRESIEVMKDLGVEASDLIVTGGGGHSPLWRQVLADVTGLQVRHRSFRSRADAAAVGAAAMARSLTRSGEVDATRSWKGSTITEPVRENESVYEAAYAAFGQIGASADAIEASLTKVRQISIAIPGRS